MFIRTIKTLRLFAIVLCCLLPNVSPANEGLAVNSNNNIITSSVELAADLINSRSMSIKRGEPYDEVKDPALHKSSPPEDGPEHGFFAVSFVILLIAGIFIYFLKTD